MEKPTLQQRLAHRSFVSASIIASVAFFESTINELFTVCADHPNDAHVRGRPGDSRFRCIGAGTVTRLGALCRIDAFQRCSVMEKYQTALRLADKEEFDLGTNPYQDAKLVVQLRNSVVHFRPEERPVARGAGKFLPPDDLELKYRGKFPINPLRPKYSMFSTPGSGPVQADFPFFPGKCLGSGCAHWAFQSSLALANSLFDRLGTTWYYHWLFDKGLIPRPAE